MAQRYLAADAYGKRFYFKPGDSLWLRLTNEKRFTWRRLTSVQDSFAIFDARLLCGPSEILALRIIPDRKKLRFWKKITLYSGAALPVVSLANGLISGERPLVTPWSLAAGGTLLATYGILMAITHIPRTIYNPKGNKIKMLILDPLPQP
ncbi:MAG: hypothetical protein NZM65_05340 [Flavobacteriales bacterium]|nr:hypothetical protein [Flavobacteriales bacterium]MDW8410096.1 hypothetical protein [Flavobacteriales bacterium]